MAAGDASAGEQIINSRPAYNPLTAFSNSTVQGQSVRPDTVRISGNTTVTPTPSSTASITCTGSFTGFAGERATAAYSFVVDSNVSFPVQYILEGAAGDGAGLGTAGTILPGLHQYRGTFEASGQTFSRTTRSGFTMTISFVSGAAAASRGQEAVAAGTMAVSIEQFDIQLARSSAAVIAPAQLLNISTRLAVQTGENVLIAGFIVTGDVPKRILIRGLGPSLAASNVSGALQNPLLELNGGTSTNDNWKSGGQQAEIEATGIPPTDDRESAMIATLNPGAHSAVLRGVDNTTGIGLVEVYDLAQGVNAKLANISSRGFVQTGNDVMIGGFILGPASNSSSIVVVRAIGPSLGSRGVANPLANPTLELRDSQGGLIDSNDDWQQGSNSTTISNRGLAAENSKESALLAIPPPGNYTAIVSGVDNTVGVGLVEVYQLQ